MSAPDTNVEKQKQNHAAPLIGLRVVVGFALVLLFGLLIWTSFNGNTPQTPAEQIDGRTGAVVD